METLKFTSFFSVQVTNGKERMLLANCALQTNISSFKQFPWEPEKKKTAGYILHEILVV